MFANRVAAGEQLANIIKGLILSHNVLVIGIPRGGMVVADVIARRLDAPLGAVIVKKIPAPQHTELAIGAYGEKDILYWDKALLEELHIGPAARRELLHNVAQQVTARQRLFSSWYKRPSERGKDVLLVDDGIATGATAICAAEVIQALGAKTIFLVTPVIPEQVVAQVRSHVMEIITIETPRDFAAVGQFYQSFPEVSDEEVKRILIGNIHHSNRLQE